MASYYNPSKRLSEWAAAALSPFIQLETEDGQTDQSRLSVGIWSGNVQLRNVELRPEAFDKYLNPNETDYNEYGTRVRWKIVRGSIDNVSVGIPWKRLLVGTSYSSFRRGKQQQVAGSQSEINQSVQRQDSDLGETSSFVAEDKQQTAKQQPIEDDKALFGCTTIKIDGVCLILGYDVIHQDTSLDSSQNQSIHSDVLPDEESMKELREKKNRILQTAERRLLAGLDPFPPSLTESLQNDIQFVLKSSMEQSMSEHPQTNSPDENPCNNSTTNYRSKVENYFTSTIKSLLWRTYDSLSISVTHVKMSVVGISHYDKNIRVLGKKKQHTKPADREQIHPKHRQRSSLHNFNRTSTGSRFELSSSRFISTDVWDMNWEPYPATIHTPVKQRSLSRKSALSLEKEPDDDESYDNSKVEIVVDDDDDKDAAIWSREGHVEMGFILDKLEVRPGLDAEDHADDPDLGPISVKHSHFCRIGAFVRRGSLSTITAKRIRDPKTGGVPKEKKSPWHGLDQDDLVIVPTNIEVECKFYRHAVRLSDATTVTSTRTTKDREGIRSAKMGHEKNDNGRQEQLPSDRSHSTTGTKRRGKREKCQSKQVKSPFEPQSTIHTIESSFTESCLLPKQLEVNCTVGHICSVISSRHMYLMSSHSQSLSRLKQGRPSTTIQSAKVYDRKLIERMAEEGQPVITALDVHMYRVLPQLRSTKYSRRTLLTLPRVALSWWKYAIMSVISELKQREQLMNICSGGDRGQSSSNLTTTQKLQWNWNEQSRIRNEYIELYLLVNSSPDEIAQQSTPASVFAAESRLKEIESGLPIERILLLRKVSRAASLGNNGLRSTAPVITFYDYSSTDRQSYSIHLDQNKTRTENSPRLGRSNRTAMPSLSKPSSPLNKTHSNLLFLCSTVTITGFSLALCELHHVPKRYKNEKNDDKEDMLSDDISALTGYSDISVDLSSLHQTSEQQTACERFDPSYPFWENENLKFRHEPISLLHLSDISVSVQHSFMKQKYRVLVVGAWVHKASHSSTPVFSIGCISGSDLATPVIVPCISILTVCNKDSAVSTLCSMKSSLINVDWRWIQYISTFISINTETARMSNLPPLHKEQNLRKLISNTSPASKMPLCLECESVQVTVPIDNEVIALNLKALKMSAGPELNRADPNEGGAVNADEYELTIMEASAQIQSRSSTHDAVVSRDLLSIPIKVRARNSVHGCHPISVEISPICLLVCEIRARTILKVIRQCFTFCNDRSGSLECLKPSLPAIAEYTLNEFQLSIDTIRVRILSDQNSYDIAELQDSSLALEHLQKVTANYLSLISCLDTHYPNEDAMDCMAKLLEDQCINLGILPEDAGQYIETARSNYQSELKSRNGESRTGNQGARSSHGIGAFPESMEQIIDKASEKTVSAISTDMALKLNKVPEGEIIIQTEAVHLSLSSHYRKSMVQAKAKCLKVRNDTGINFLDIPEAENGMALVFSLSSLEANAKNTVRQEVYFEVEKADATFNAEAYLNAVSRCRNLFDAIFMNTNPTNTSDSAGAVVINGAMTSASIIFTDDFIPFLRFHGSDLSFDHSSGERSTPTTSLSTKDVLLQCTSPSLADSYPNIVTTHQDENFLDCNGHCALTIRIQKEMGVNSDVNKVSASIHGVRLTVLRRFINEVIQYISSPEFGLGLFLKSIQTTDPSPTSQPQVTMKATHSTVILPRDSNSVDLVGIEVDELSVSPVYVKDSWAVDSSAFACRSTNQPNFESTRSSFSETFFDCIDDQATFDAPQTSEILRIAINLEGARLFTALNAKQHSPDCVNLSMWNRFVKCTGRCEENKSVYKAKMNSTNPLTAETRARIWQEVTQEPLNLALKADLDPSMGLRLLIEMIGNSFLDMRMSSLYLILSIWYSNMQELPVLFPYDADFIEKASATDPPLDWPEYGSDEFVERLMNGCTEKTFELVVCINNLRLDCSFDKSGYFLVDPPTISLLDSDAVSLSLEHAICNIVSDQSNVLRVGIGAKGLCILDRSAATPYKQHIRVENATDLSPIIDQHWGLNCGIHTLVDGLPLPFQVTVFMTPDNHCMINLGADYLEGAIENLSSIWILLDYFGLYFTDAAYGHPYFLAKQVIQEVSGTADIEQAGLDIDFRLWLTRPHLVIPTSSSEICIMLESAGIHYRYKSYGLTYSSQEVIAKELAIVALRQYADSSASRGLRQVSGCLRSNGAQTLIDDLSFSVQYDFNESTNYTKLAVCIPLSNEHLSKENMVGIETGNIDVYPYLCKAPLVCKPFFLPPRDMKNKFTAHFSMEYMKLAVDTLIAFVGPKHMNDTPESEIPSQRNFFSITARVEGAELVLSDPVMGFHRPILSISLPSLIFSASQLKTDEQLRTLHSSHAIENDLHDNDLQMSLETSMFIDYFKLGKTRNWEPLVEPFQCLVLYDKSSVRGQGITVNLDCPLHFNVTSAALDTFDDAKETFESFYKQLDAPEVMISKPTDLDYATIECPTSNELTLLHSRAAPIDESERRAFTLRNITGQQIRVHSLSTNTEDDSRSKVTIHYLDHKSTMPLSFPATLTAYVINANRSVRHMEHVEVAVEDVKRSSHHHHHHEIDIQIPGFKWLHGVSMEETGRKFIGLNPRSSEIQSKIDADWRLSNSIQVLVDIRAINGGRRLSLLSPFEVVNKTDHSISLSFSPDPLHCPQSENSFSSEKVDPDEACTVPHLLLQSALQITGAHLGSIWIKPTPDTFSSRKGVLCEPKAVQKNQVVKYPTRPIQLAKIVHETSVIWSNSKADSSVANQFASGTEITCPIQDDNNRQAIPFSYVVEVKRSPLASQQIENTASIPQEVLSPSKSLKSTKNKPIKSAVETLRHQPVHYSLLIHPPIVIENLLPERGRFELMHAINRSVLWWGILEPGEKIPVHRVGLDAPILMLVNLRFCRTPVGGGALVHNGRDSEGLFKAGWNSLGNAMKSSRERVKKTLYAVAESKDNRGAGRVSDMKRRMNRRHEIKETRKNGLMGFNEHETENGNRLWCGDAFDADAIDTEIVVVDSIGQRLTLLLDNVIGGGGQRFISLFCPYWIVNTTNYPLRYKQEKVAGYVSGTVISPELDGSKRVDSSNRNDEEGEELDLLDVESEGPYSTIFPGRSGALHGPGPALDPVVLTSLISEELPLSIMSALAFMFNFQDTISLGSPPRLCLQLADAADSNSEYTSAWSSGFGLESVGVTQIVGMHCRDGRRLEVSVSVAIAPGRLSNYTKVVRICPRYVIVNQLTRSIRLWQDNSMLHPAKPIDDSLKVNSSEKWTLSNSNNYQAASNEYKALFGEKIVINGNGDSSTVTTAHPDACYIASVNPSEIVTFHLPDTRVDRLLRIEYGSGWNLSSSLPADVTGEHHLSLTRALDLRLLPKVSTRAAPVYTVTIPSPGKEWDGELGTYFETDWGRERTLIVKGVKESSYAAHWTDITVGDELLRIDDIPVEQLSFEEAIKLIKIRLSSVTDKAIKRKISAVSEPKLSVVLTFMTFEERMRSLRRKAVIGRAVRMPMDSRRNLISKNATEDSNMSQSKDLMVDMKFLYQSIFMFVQESKTNEPPHIIRNRSLKWAIFYRQRSCENHQWFCLYPGESAAYTWQEPTKPKKLSVRVGTCELMSGSAPTTDAKLRTPFLSLYFVKNEEQGFYGVTKTVKLEEIGHMESLPVPTNRNERQNEIFCIVDTEGTTRALIISDEIKESYSDDEALMKRHLANIRKEILLEDRRRAQLDALNNILTAQANKNGNIPSENCDLDNRSVHNLNMIESELQELIDFGEGQYIAKRHQVLVQVLEATGLMSADLNGLSNPYVKLNLKYQTSSFKNLSRSTYFVEKTLSPKWSQQIFVFDVPAKASHDPKETRNVSVCCTVKSLEKVGKDRFLGQVQVQLRDLINQQEVVGWYPLMGGLGRQDADSMDRIRGSLKMRVHYVSDYQGLISFHQLCSERRIDSLRQTKSGMQRQLRALRETAKEQAEARESLPAIPALTMSGKKNKRVSKIDLARDEGLLQSSKIIQGVRDGTEHTLKKSIGIAKSVVRGKMRGSKTRSISEVDQDLRSRCDTDDTINRKNELVINEHGIFDEPTRDIVPPSAKDDITSGAVTKPLLQVDWTSDQSDTSHSRVSALRDRCRGQPLAIITSNRNPFPSWVISRTFYSYNAPLKPIGTLDLGQTTDKNEDFPNMLKLPPSSPSFFQAKEKRYMDALMASRQSFAKKARRSLKNIVNPGGVLTIRPITALNLSDEYTGMFIKLRYGTTIQLSQSVDCRVSPVWTREDENNLYQSDLPTKKKRRHSLLKLKRKRSLDTGPTEFADLAEIVNPLARWGRPRKNDLQVEITPFETSSKLRLSIIGERIQSSVEIGILDIELGPALECCAKSMEEFEEDRSSEEPKGLPPAYVRWFPLTPPSDAIPVEGDMGQRVKPKESEKKRDDQFCEYFCPCIKLALMFKPHLDDTDEENQEIVTIKRSSDDQYLYVKLDRISAALIDSNRIGTGELLSFTSRDADLRMSLTKAKARLSFALGNVQIDQMRLSQDLKAPVILAPTPVKHPQPVVQFLVWKDNTRSKPDLDSFDYVALEIQDLDLKIEETWLFDLWEFYVSIVRARERKESSKLPKHNISSQFSSGGAEEATKSLTLARSFLQSPNAITASKKVYIRELILGYMRCSLWYYKRGNWSSTVDDLIEGRYDIFLSPSILSHRMSDKAIPDEAFRQWSENVAFGDAEDSMSASTVNLVSAIIPSISDASVSFQGKLIEHVFETQGDVWKSLRSHYSSEALKQIYKIIGSLDFVGNPSMLLTSFRTGLKDFIMQPSRELRHLTKNPSRVGVGVVKGTVSLFSNSTSGIFGFFSTLGSSAGQTVAKFTFDEHFQRHHSEKQTAQQQHYDRWKRKGCGHVTLMITRPMHDIIFGVISASTGLLTEPYRGAKRNGVIGFSTGVGVGVLGVVIKPVVGLCDAFSHFMGSIDDMAKSVNLVDVKFKPIERYRYPYTFGAGRMLMPFNQTYAKSAHLLFLYPIDKKSKRSDEIIVTAQALHTGPGCEHYIIISTRRIVSFKLRDLDGTGYITTSLDWQIRFATGFIVSSRIGTKGYNRTVLHITSASERAADDVSSSGSLESDDFRWDSKHDGCSFNLDRSTSVPETPKAFRLRNTRLFSSADTEMAQRFVIEGDFGQRRQLIQVHNAICCLSGDVKHLIYEENHGKGNEGITSFGSLTFDDECTRAEFDSKDPRVLFSALDRALWVHPQHDSAFCTYALEQAVSTLQDNETTGAPESLNHFTFSDISFLHKENASLEQHDFTSHQSPEPSIVIKNEHPPTFQAPSLRLSEPGLGSQFHGSNIERVNDNGILDSRLRRVEELLEHLVYKQASPGFESGEPDNHEQPTQNPASVREAEDGFSDETTEVGALRNEIDELKRNMAQQAEANEQLKAQIEANKSYHHSKAGLNNFFSREKKH